MATEPFLINPPKKAPKAKKAKKLNFGKEGSIHRPLALMRSGHWRTSDRAKKVKPGLALNPFRRLRRRMRHNPFGEEMMIIGSNPFAKERYSMLNPFRFHRRKRHNPRRKHRRNPMHGFYSKARGYRRNPWRRRHRRNPVDIAGAMTNYAPMVLGGTVGAVAVNMLPKLLGLVGIPKYGVQAAIVVGGGMAVEKIAKSKKAADGWIVGSAAVVLYGILQNVLRTALSGLGVDVDTVGNEELAAYPEYSAFPDDEDSGGYLPGGTGYGDYGYADFGYEMTESAI